MSVSMKAPMKSKDRKPVLHKISSYSRRMWNIKRIKTIRVPSLDWSYDNKITQNTSQAFKWFISFLGASPMMVLAPV